MLIKLQILGPAFWGQLDAIQKVGNISSKNQADQVNINLKKITDITAAAVGLLVQGLLNKILV